MELTIEEVMQQAVGAHQEGELQGAYHLYCNILQAQPDHPEANHNLGVLAVSLNQSEEALPLFRTALEANPKIEQFWLSYIKTLINKGYLGDAKRAQSDAIKVGVAKDKIDALGAHLAVGDDNEYPPQSQLNSLLEHYQNERYIDAEKLAISITQEFPDHPFTWKVLGAILGQTDRSSEALDASKKAVALAPQDPEAQYNLGVTLQELDRLEEAELSYRQAIDLKPCDADTHNNLGLTLKSLERLDEAVASYKQAIAMKPDLAGAHGNLGNALKELGRLEEAEASLRQAIALKSDYAEAYSSLANTLHELGRLEEAEARYRQAIHLKPYDANARNNLGNIFRDLGRLDDAEASYMAATALNPDFAGAHNNLGDTLLVMGRLDESVSSFQQAFASRTGINPVGDGVLAPATTSLYFELTNKCNFHCTFCPSDSQKRNLGFMNLELVKQLYEENAEKKIANEVNLHLMGEPTLHPELIEILKFGASKNIRTELVTNISTLVAKNVPQILDTLYGRLTASHMTPTEETYQFRGKVGLSWDRYINNLRLLVREYMKRLGKGKAVKNEVTIRVMATENTASNVIINDKPNEANAILKEWNDFVAGVEQELGMAPFKRQDHDTDDLLKGNNQASISFPLQQGLKLTFWRAFTFANTRVSDDFELKTTRQAAYCPHPFTDVGVLWNGDVTLCCLDHDGQLNVGNIRDSSIETVIQSEAAQKLRASMLGEQPLPPVCQNCQAKPVKRDDT